MRLTTSFYGNVQETPKSSCICLLCECCGIFISLTAIGDSFDKYMAEFNVLLIASLRNIAVHQVGMVKSDHYSPLTVYICMCVYIILYTIQLEMLDVCVHVNLAIGSQSRTP